MSHSSKSFFPTQPMATIVHDESGNATGYANEVSGGVTKREMFALEIFCALLSNPGLRTPTVESLGTLAIKETDRFLEALEAPPEVPGPKESALKPPLLRCV